MASRISKKFASAQAQGRGILGVFVSAGDPNEEICVATLDALVEAGADMIELGMPFSDPMADGPAIQAASLRAIAAGMNLEKTLKIAADFRDRHPDIPLILMGYFNPIYIYGRDAFIKAAVSAGVDGLIIVDLPPEEDVELCDPARQAGLDHRYHRHKKRRRRQYPKCCEHHQRCHQLACRHRLWHQNTRTSRRSRNNR